MIDKITESLTCKIRKKMPIWKQGGKMDNTVQFPKVRRNEPCPCGSRKKI